MMSMSRCARYGLLVAGLPLAGCSGLLDVESPGRIADDDLNEVDAIPGLVIGMSSDLMEAYDASLDDISLAALELWHGGSYDYADIPRGIILPEDVNGEWAQMQQARWVAEQGIERIKAMPAFADEFNSSALVARAYLLAGFANRLLGENVCETAIDGGPREPHTVHFERAVEQFTTAITIGTAAEDDDIVTAAHAGRASAVAWLGDWDGAVNDAAEVPTDFVYFVLFGTEDDNDIHFETFNRPEYTVYLTEFMDHPDDPRAPWRTVFEADGDTAKGANGATPFLQQRKYEETGADVAAVKGTEMLVLRAEAELREGDIAAAIDLLNEARAFYEMDAIATPATLEEAWEILFYERGATTWLEGRRLWDLRRWYEETGPGHNDWRAEKSPSAGQLRDVCFPISENELRSNPNL